MWGGGGGGWEVGISSCFCHLRFSCHILFQDEPVKFTDNHNIENAVKGATEFKPVSPDVVMETIPSEDAAIEINQEDIQLCKEESSIGLPVDEQQAGPSDLPVEWQGATVVRPLLIYINLFY